MDLKASCADLSRYVCFVCGCALAARVLAPLRLDEELWWFYVLACGGVLFGPLVGVLPERWHGQATARQLAVARVVYLVLLGVQRLLPNLFQFAYVLAATVVFAPLVAIYFSAA